MNRAQLAKALALKTKMSLKRADKLIIAFGDTVSDVLTLGEKIVYSNFGTFYTVHYPSKVIYHPVFGKSKKMIMLPTDSVKWMPSENVKAIVASGQTIDRATKYGAAKEFEQLINRQTPPMATADQPAETTPIIEDQPVPVDIKTSVSEPFHTSSSKINLESEENKSFPAQDAAQVENKLLDSPENEKESEKKIMPESETPILSRSLSSEISGGTTQESKPLINQDEDANRDYKKNAGFWEQLFHKANTKVTVPADATSDHKEEAGQNDGGIFGKINDLTPDSGASSEKPAREAVETPDSSPKLDSLPKDETSTESPTLSTAFSNRQKKIDYLDLSKTTVPKEILSIIPEKVAREYKIAPVSQTDTELVVGMVDPEDIEALEIVKKIAQKKVTPKLVTESDISHVLEQYQAFESEIEKAIEDVDKSGKVEKAQEDKSGDIPFSVSDSAPAARIVNSLIKRAIRDKASDIHIEPAENEVVARFRIDGVLQKKASLPKDIQAAVISRIKILANLKIDEQRLPQDGRFSLKTDDHKVDFRISTMPVANGEKVVMRILDKMTGVMSIDNLGFRQRDLEVIGNNIKKAHGMVLVTGPTGSGKTTTLYALISKIYAEGINIITLEDPIEYQISGVNQSQVNPEIDYTFASGLRSILRQDPDVVMIGEIRDNETAEMAIHAALTGHVVLSTLHTNDSAGAIPRLTDMSVEPFLLNSSLNIVIAQRLARRICENCKEKFTLAENDLKTIKDEIGKLPENQKMEIPADFVFYHGKGCKECGESGYKGRIGLYEVLEVSAKIRDLTSQKASSEALQETAIAEGMSTVIQDGIIKALQGSTSIEEVWRVAKE